MSGEKEAQVDIEGGGGGGKPKLKDQRDDNPIKRFSEDEIKTYVDALYKKNFESKTGTISIVSRQELLIGAAHAKFYLEHDEAKEEFAKVLDGEDISRLAETGKCLGKREYKAYRTQKDAKFWHEPKDLLVTLLACCLASFTQGWDQVANGNLGWPGAFHLNINSVGSGGKLGGTGDFWIVGGVNCITWFSAAFLGPFFVDPLSQWTDKLGRRGAVLIAALFSLASMIGGSRSTSWQGYFIARLFLGIGIGAKASLVPIWESETLPPAKRGRLLVSWQFFTATGIFAGSVASYIFRTNWRNQVLSGALPALVLLIVTYFGTESPRYLILHGKYEKAFTALLRLRRERILAAEELCYIHFLIQAERTTLLDDAKTEDFGKEWKPLGYFHRLYRIVKISRNKHAALATMVVMLSQQLSGINILGFVSSIFFSAAGLRKQPEPNDDAKNLANAYDSLKFSIGFGVANAVFSAIAYFLIEPLEKELPEMKNAPIHQPKGRTVWKWKPSGGTRSCLKLFRGRRALLMTSLGGGALMLFILTFLLRLDPTNEAKLPLVMIFIILWNLFYSPGAGAVPFLYSAEVWPNEGREVGMSWAVFWNFFGAGFLALFVPRGLKWGPPKLFGLFTGLSVLGVILVYLFVPGTDRATSLDDMSKKFDHKKYTDFSKDRMKTLINPTRLRKTSTAKVQPGAPAAPTPGAPETQGNSNEQGTAGTDPGDTGSLGSIQEPEEEEDDPNASQPSNVAEEIETQGGTANPISPH
ncbi:MFS general substrate transporter [Amniculicola lignicola CBS 123094]|uniref:MFS general substrate transporter n=1 Tax=Amniculicola lignicola CBS 123094 TaxID=1392246 RepID=A0A6A5WR05_9PLEO|nr:MFS general substrate transporter [Amniculicola lignicola CBS 123094]